MARAYFCPRCLDRVTEESVRYADGYGNDAKKPDVAYQRDAGSWLRAVWRGVPDALYQTDPKVRARAMGMGVHARCPEGHRVPQFAFDVPTVVLAMVGEGASGKTVYLGTLLEQLGRRRLPDLGFETDEYSEKLRHQIFADFYHHDQTPPATTEARDDLQREAISGLVSAQGSPKYYLSFFDASGEENNPADPGRVNQFLFRADAVMHFVTPEALGLPRTSARRDDQRQTYYVTDNAIRTAIGAARRDAHAAVVIPKSDDIDSAALDMLQDARAELDFKTLGLAGAYDVIQQDSAYLRGVLLGNPDSEALVERIEDHYRTTSYHLVSATGGPADPVTERFRKRRPQRVLDPLLVSLVAAGAIDLKSGRTRL